MLAPFSRHSKMVTMSFPLISLVGLSHSPFIHIITIFSLIHLQNIHHTDIMLVYLKWKLEWITSSLYSKLHFLHTQYSSCTNLSLVPRYRRRFHHPYPCPNNASTWGTFSSDQQTTAIASLFIVQGSLTIISKWNLLWYHWYNT